MDVFLANNHFRVIDTIGRITIADSFVVRQNKIGTGNGEAKLYIGQNNQETRSFFGEEGFDISCFLLKADLLKYLEETKVEYLRPEQPYINRTELPELWDDRKKIIEALPMKIEFKVTEQTQILGSRVYIKSNDSAYNLMRELSLPNITFISVVKLLDRYKKLNYYFRLFADFFGEDQHPFIIENEEKTIISSSISSIEKKQLIRARIGQGEYRQKLLRECPFCPITLVADDRLLTASHIKPWAISNDFEKTDPKNGFMFTPTFDRLFDRGFISFTDDKRVILSPFLSNMTYSKLGISDNKLIVHLPIDGRQEYLKFHRTEILKR